MPTNRRLRRRNRTFKPTDQTLPQAETEDSAAAGDPEETAPAAAVGDPAEPAGGEPEETRPAKATANSAEPEGGEPDATAPADEEAAESADSAEPEGGEPGQRGPSRLARRGWLVGITAALLLAAAGLGAGGYLALRYHHQAQAIARGDAAALKAAVDCVSATQAPDTTAMAASEQKIIECGTDAFRSQALLYTSMIVQAYQAANIHVQVADVRAAVERNNTDGTVDVLVAMRVKVASDQTQKETGYRLRVKMALADGQYKISRLDQVTK